MEMLERSHRIEYFLSCSAEIIIQILVYLIPDGNNCTIYLHHLFRQVSGDVCIMNYKTTTN